MKITEAEFVAGIRARSRARIEVEEVEWPDGPFVLVCAYTTDLQDDMPDACRECGVLIFHDAQAPTRAKVMCARCALSRSRQEEAKQKWN